MNSESVSYPVDVLGIFPGRGRVSFFLGGWVYLVFGM